jgi:hypothetical protein
VATIPGDEFMEATLDVWEIPAESATRVGHPAPFPVALVERCIQLFTYDGDVVLDPFMGSGTTAVAAVNTNRRYIGFDTDPTTSARRRSGSRRWCRTPPASAAPSRRSPARSSTRRGSSTSRRTSGCRPGVTVSFRAVGADGIVRLFELGGTHTPARSGLARIDVVWRTIAKASIAHQVAPGVEFVVLSSGTVRGGPIASVSGSGRPIAQVIDVTAPDALDRLTSATTSVDDS